MTKVFVIVSNKCGTTSLHAFVRASGLSCAHWRLSRDRTLAVAMFSNLSLQQHVLEGFSDFDVYSDIDHLSDTMHLEANTLFRTIAATVPDARFILSTRHKNRRLASSRSAAWQPRQRVVPGTRVQMLRCLARGGAGDLERPMGLASCGGDRVFCGQAWTASGLRHRDRPRGQAGYLFRRLLSARPPTLGSAQPQRRARGLIPSQGLFQRRRVCAFCAKCRARLLSSRKASTGSDR